VFHLGTPFGLGEEAIRGSEGNFLICFGVFLSSDKKLA